MTRSRRSSTRQTKPEKHATGGFGGSPFFPLSLNLSGKRILIAGSRVSTEHIRYFVEAGALVELLADRVAAELRELAVTYCHRLKLVRRPVADILDGKIEIGAYLMVLALTDSDEDNQRLVAIAEERGVLASTRALSEPNDFLIPTLFRRGRVKITVSADGVSRALERALLQQIELSLSAVVDRAALFAEFAGEAMERLREELAVSGAADKEEIVEQLIDLEEVYLALQRQSYEEAEQRLSEAIEKARQSASSD